MIYQVLDSFCGTGSLTFGVMIILNTEKKTVVKSVTFAGNGVKQALKRNKFVIMGIEA